MDSLHELLKDMKLAEIVEFYSKSQDDDNRDDKELVSLYNHELEYMYGKGDLESLDFAQLRYLRGVLESAILYKV